MNLPPFSFAIFFCLLVIILASSAIFYSLTHRWTSDRRRAAMEDWAVEQRFRMHTAPAAALPAALQSLQSLNARVDISFTRGPLSLLQLTTISQPLSKQSQWHILMRELDRAWTPAGLRPVHPERSFLDLFSLTGFPSLLPPERFVIVASDGHAAKEMMNSPVRGLLPPDVGLMVHGPYVTIDFSERPFDTIEFERMIAVMEQIVSHLPAHAEAPAR
jgi:hypothetical protein